MDKKVRIIALYLPQFHPTPDNDKWWGKGFTEWTNVGKAKALFKGHYQPKVPADLGYYDLRLPEVRVAQAELAQEAGVEGFCYYHYWFGNGKQELELPFKEVVKSGEPDFPFCLCWANESWHSKFWNMDGTIRKKCLIEQIYDTCEGHVQHFNSLLSAFKDKRYIKVNGKPLFMIYKPFEFVDQKEFIELWNKLAQDNGLPGIYFVAHLFSNVCQQKVDELHALGFDAVNSLGLQMAMESPNSILYRIYRKINILMRGMPRAMKYSDVYHKFISEVDKNDKVFPTLVPNWDHTPRSGSAGTVLIGSTPQLFKKHVHEVFELIKHKKSKEQIVFLKSWNEWGEGNYMEPDLRFGKGYIKALRDELEIFNIEN